MSWSIQYKLVHTVTFEKNVIQIFITEHVIQDNTTTTDKDILHIIVQATIIITLVDGGGGLADAVDMRK